MSSETCRAVQFDRFQFFHFTGEGNPFPVTIRGQASKASNSVSTTEINFVPDGGLLPPPEINGDTVVIHYHLSRFPEIVDTLRHGKRFFVEVNTSKQIAFLGNFVDSSK